MYKIKRFNNYNTDYIPINELPDTNDIIQKFKSKLGILISKYDRNYNKFLNIIKSSPIDTCINDGMYTLNKNNSEVLDIMWNDMYSPSLKFIRDYYPLMNCISDPSGDEVLCINLKSGKLFKFSLDDDPIDINLNKNEKIYNSIDEFIVSELKDCYDYDVESNPNKVKVDNLYNKICSLYKIDIFTKKFSEEDDFLDYVDLSVDRENKHTKKVSSMIGAGSGAIIGGLHKGVKGSLIGSSIGAGVGYLGGLVNEYNNKNISKKYKDLYKKSNNKSLMEDFWGPDPNVFGRKTHVKHMKNMIEDPDFWE